MSDVERADMGSQAEASSSSKRDMGSYISTMKPSDVKTLTRKYKIPRDLHPVAVSSEWTMDRLTDEYIGLYEQYFEFVGLRVPFSTFLLAVIRHFHVHISQLVPLGLTRLTLFELYCRSLNIVPSVTLFRVFYKLSKQGDWFSFEKRAGKDFRGKILNETFSCMKKWKGRFFFIDRRAIPDAMCWRHHDSDISDPAPKDGFDEADVITLTHQPIDIRGIPSGLLFSAGLAITWEFPKFRPLFKDPEGNGVLGNRDGNFDDDVDEEVDLEGPDRHVSDTAERVKECYFDLPAGSLRNLPAHRFCPCPVMAVRASNINGFFRLTEISQQPRATSADLYRLASSNQPVRGLHNAERFS
ncbi:hypothetical protein Tco_1112247 [Tanacetum coccineum]|uniref:Transposase (putative) gypsy type domain-containing protein n=1 Tax=Tanacetum coccineum TaxID=301880 RepID=A0ABQ5IP79_9ASTR